MCMDIRRTSTIVIHTDAVEKNGQIVPKSAYESTVIKDGDSLEVVSFVGGG